MVAEQVAQELMDRYRKHLKSHLSKNYIIHDPFTESLALAIAETVVDLIKGVPIE